MRTRLLLAGVLAAVLPSAALAQPPDPNCVASNHASRVEGTVLGGVAGALIGGAIGHGAGAAVGGLTGAVAGNAIAGSRNDPCPPGYYYAPPPGAPGYGPPPPPPPEASGFWGGAPTDVRQRIDWVQSRIEREEASGRINHEQTRWAYNEIRNIRASAHHLWERDGSMTPADADYIQSRLNNLGQQLHWMQRTNY